MPSQNRSDYKSNSGGDGGNGIFGGKRTKSANDPSYSAFSVKGLTSSDPANVARNQAAAARYADMPASNDKADERERKKKSMMADAPKPERAAVTPPTVETPKPPRAPEPVIPADTTSTYAPTIATTPRGLLATEEPIGLLRLRRSIMGGGLIK